jgi:hypothetical protein
MTVRGSEAKNRHFLGQDDSPCFERPLPRDQRWLLIAEDNSSPAQNLGGSRANSGAVVFVGETTIPPRISAVLPGLDQIGKRN